MPELAPVAPYQRTSSDRADMTTAPTANFLVKFWGVRDKVSAPGKDTIRYGGNTSCVEMNVGKKRLIFDGGSGLRVLGNSLLSQMPVEAYIFFTHCHWDSIQGFPFFTPAFIPGNCFHIYGGKASNGASIEDTLIFQMRDPNFPVPLQVMRSELNFHDLTSGKIISLDDVTVEAVSLNHAHRSMGYRVTWQGHSAVYATDRSNYPHHIDQKLLHLARQADLLILDAPQIISTNDLLKCDALAWKDNVWQSGIETAKAAGVKRIVMSRYNPDHDDDFLDKVEEQVHSVFPNNLLAREGMTLQVF